MLFSDMEPMDYLKIFQRRKWLVVFLILVITLGALMYCVVTPEQFKSTTTILIVPQRVPESYVHSTVSLRVEDRMATIQQQIMSRTRLMMVIDELGLFKDVRKVLPPEELVEMMRKKIDIEVKGKESFLISFSHSDPQTAMLVTSRLVSFFIDENLKARELQAIGTSEFLESQLANIKDKLETQEEKVKQYKMRYTGELPQQVDANLSMLRRLQDLYRAKADAIHSAEQRRDFLEARINLLEMSGQSSGYRDGKEEDASMDPRSLYDPAQPLLVKLNEKQAILADLSRRYTSEYPEVVRVRREIEQLEKEVIAARTSAATTATLRPAGSKVLSRQVTPRDQVVGLHAQVKAAELEISTLKGELKETEKSISNVQLKVEQAPKREQEMIAMVRDYENLKRQYDDILRKKLDAEISQNLEKRQKGEQFQILDPPNLPMSPFKPDRRMILGFGLVLAFAAGCGIPLGLEILDPTLRDKKSFRHAFDLPILVSLPIIRDESYERRLWIRKAAVFGGFVSITTAVAVFLLIYGGKVRSILHGTGLW